MKRTNTREVIWEGETFEGSGSSRIVAEHWSDHTGYSLYAEVLKEDSMGQPCWLSPLGINGIPKAAIIELWLKTRKPEPEK
jgi:hypothetical protein